MMFVLRDQRDRTTKVQRDSLAQMRKMLKEAMGSAQKNLDDLVSLRQDAIFLLPSAFYEAKREGRTVESPSAVFSEEAFALRGKILQFTLGDRSTLELVENCDLLVVWYRHACIVWDILTKYGYTSCHYKALNELRLHKEINEIMTSLVKQAEIKFHNQASTVVRNHEGRLWNARDEKTVEKYDTECRAELNRLKELIKLESERNFKDNTQAKKYNEDLKEEFCCKLGSPVSSVYEFHLYSWQKRLQSATDRLNTVALDQRFSEHLENELKRTKYQSSLSTSDAAKIFDESWSRYEMKYTKHLEEKKTTKVIEHEIVTTFIDVLTRHRHDDEILGIVASSSCSVELLTSTHFVKSTPNEWFDRYIEIPFGVLDMGQRVWKELIKRLAEVSSKSHKRDTNISREDVKAFVVSEMRKEVNSLRDSLATKIAESYEKSQEGQCDAAIVTDIVHQASEIVMNMQPFLTSYSKRLKLRRAPFINHLIVYLQQVACRAVCSAEEKRMSEEKKELEMKRVRKRRTFLTMVSKEAGDLERAATFAEEYSQHLNVWVNILVDNFALEVRGQVHEEMPNPEKAAERAYNNSFRLGNYDEVLEYCIDVNAYLKKLFLQMFENRKQVAIEKKMDKLKDRVSEMYNVIINVAERWRQSFQPSGRLADFKAYLAKCAENKCESASVRNLLIIALERFPQITNFPISKVEIFYERFKGSMGELLREVQCNYLQAKVNSSMSDQREKLWKEIKGCQAKCPLCGSKCSLVYEHKDHKCGHHIFPAFHGTRIRDLDYPVFDRCLSRDTAEETWVRDDDPSLPNLAAFLDHYDDCRPWKKSLVPDPTLPPLPVQQIEAWVTCRKPLLKYWNLVDKTPDEWLIYQSKKPLEEDECDKAKARLEKYRDIRWQSTRNINCSKTVT
ncbi:uncharacterized protein LOC134194805 [Corticium candelabrum]|uniref:uncharacterized protein LOC134194805 n=1 Tax=Corticium candelabrum TaxID=121492 RepID=UPI002E276A44|nr:uncharacterized protein LOC134194805 [Corticium candelabrum]